MTAQELRVREELGLGPADDLLAAVRAARDTDPLTGLPNRRALERDLAAEPRRKLTVLILDLCAFKQVNDEHGHLAGDEVLRHAARRFRSRLRAGDRLYRWGGDEFAVLLRAKDGYGATLRLERVLRTPGLPSVRVSVGAGASVAEADRRMYEQKPNNRACRHNHASI